ncbi:MAG: hypothetical protein HQM14_17945 [SAR324 cluster bacterium]|nr:hypothetical protein [SAR324 cluster bacterium]
MRGPCPPSSFANIDSLDFIPAVRYIDSIGMPVQLQSSLVQMFPESDGSPLTQAWYHTLLAIDPSI